MKHMMASRLLTYLLYVTALLVLCAIGLWYYIMFYPFVPSKVYIPKTGAELVYKPHRGDHLYYKVRYCNYMYAPTRISYSLLSIDNALGKPVVITFPEASSVSSFNRGNTKVFNHCTDMIDGTVDLPENMPAGTWILGVTIRNKVYGTRTIEQFFETETFIIK